MKFFKKNWAGLFLALIILIAFFARFWRLSVIPPGLYPDIAVNGTDAINALKTHNFQLFYLANNGREGLFMNLIAISFAIFGISIWSIRLVSATIGLLTVLGLYFLAKELFNKKVGLLSSFFLAVSFWAVNFSRMGFRAILLPFVLVYSFYFFFRGLRTNRWLDFILGGLFFGLGLHTYISWRLAPLILIAWVFLKIILDKSFWKKYWKKLVVFVGGSIVAALPLLYYFFKNPADFMGRAGEVSVFKQKGFLKLIMINVGKALAMFNIHGDWNWRHNLSGAPMLTIPLGILFLGGLILAFVKLFKDFKGRRENKFFVYVFLILWFIVMLSPTILSSEGIPHALRALGVVPVVMILAGVFLYWFFRLKFWKRLSRYLKIIVLIILLVLIGGLETNRYFVVWAKNTNTYGAFSQNLVNIGDYINNLPRSTVKYVLVNEDGALVDNLPIPSQTIKFITYNKSYPKYVLPKVLKEIGYYPPGTVIAFIKNDPELLSYLQKKFPNSRVEKIDLKPGTQSEFNIYRIN